jgi:hypothetical protein
VAGVAVIGYAAFLLLAFVVIVAWDLFRDLSS